VVAVDCASHAIKLGRCKLAVASGVNLQLSAAIWVGFAKMRGLAPDGNCKTFDISADGFARGEGLGAVILERCGARGPEAVAAAALLGGVASNHDGRAATITAPNGTAQQRVMRNALAERGLQPQAASCLECHGTGTALGDPIEVGAQRAVYCKGRDASSPLALAAGKTNLGHLEGSAGVAGITKTVLSLQRGLIPPVLWLRQLNPNIDPGATAFAGSTELLDFRSGAAAFVGVSSFGFSGTNGHVLVERAAPPSDAPATARPVATYSRRLIQPYRPWLKDLLFNEQWLPADLEERDSGDLDGLARACVVVGDTPVASALRATLPGASQSGTGREELRTALDAIPGGARAAVFVGTAQVDEE
ncbi:unnamed protein product, partial [Polarella glacialis]